MEDHPQSDPEPKDKKQYQVTLLKKRVSFSLVQAVSFVAIFAVIGSFILIKSFAASPQAEIRGPVLDTTEAGHSTDTLLVGFKPGVSTAVQQALLARYQAKVTKDIPQTGAKLISVPAEAQDAVKDALSHNPAVSFTEYDQNAKMFDTTPNDYWWPNEWSEVTTQSNKAWDTTQGSSVTTIAILDTGVDPIQPDLQGAFVPGWNTLTNTSDTTDINGHGTNSAGVALARSNNTTGIASYCWKCSLMPVKVLDTSSGSVSSVSSGITWAVDHGAKVISMSLGFTASSSTLSNAVSYAKSHNAVVIAAAGNYGTNAMVYPAATPGVIGVAGADSTNALYSWSSFGSWVRTAAPGCNFATGTNAWYGTFCGTSSAAPAAAGIAGLLFSLASNPSAAQVEQALTSSVDTCCGGNIGGGRVNAYKAVQALGGVSTPPVDTTAPSVSISAPAATAAVSGSTNVNVSATDNVGVAKVELRIDGSLYATATASPYNFFWDTTKASNGSHTLTATAYDAAGNASSSAVTVTVSNVSDTVAPAVTITAPANGSTIGSRVSISGSATDNVAVTSMEVYVDGVLKGSSNSGSISISWNSRKAAKGTHTITIKAYDGAGNVGQSSITVTK
jgi:thermitase